MTGLRERHRRERRRKILMVADELFRENGYENTTIAQIADLANVSAVTVFNYYKTKGELLLALISDENLALLEKLSNLVQDTRLGPDALACEFFSTITRDSLKKVDKKSWRQVIATSAVMGDSEFSTAYNGLRDDLKQCFANLLETMIAQNRLSATSDLRTLVDIAYAYHYHLFTEHVSKDDTDTTAYSSALRSGMVLLFS